MTQPVFTKFLRPLLVVISLAAVACSPATSGGGNGVGVGGDASGSGADAAIGETAGDAKPGTDTQATGDSAVVQDAAADVPGAVTQDVQAADVASKDGGGDAAPGDTTSDVKTDGGASDIAKDTGGGGGPGSCVGICGQFDSGGDCHCDAGCVEFGDCCSDYEAACGCKTDADCGPQTDKCNPTQCVGGACQTSSKDCDDNNDCTADACTPATGLCTNVPEGDGTDCNPNVECKAGACKAGKCVVSGSAPDGDYCDDGNPCLDNDACNGGVCKGTDPTNCDDYESCTNDACDPGSGCTNTPVPGKVACDDDESCTTNDQCVAGSCEGTPQPDGAACDDTNPCSTGDKCDKAVCSGADAPDGVPCDDGDACTSQDTCSFGYCSGASQTCDDKIDCTDDSCDSKTGKCTYVAMSDGAWCNDGDPCTVDQACAGGNCVGKADPTLCDDSNACTLDACAAQAGTKNCTHVPTAEGVACDDGDLCTSADKCTAGVCTGKAAGCTAIFSDPIECGAAAKWTFSAPVDNVSWAIDGTPNPPQSKSGTCSLNFNNGTDYDGTGAVDGTATSQAVTLPATGKLRLAFWSWHDVESSSSYDVRTVLVSADNFTTSPVTVVLDNTDPKEQWQFVTVALDKLAGKSVMIRFAFDSVDGAANSGAGWFVDDVKVDVLP